ncbi:MAG: hypothetical protein HY301_02085 [Verrucomicrobia bacterium]|nr:hypothetical protein [Verrucomicrobiota bacterium]
MSRKLIAVFVVLAAIYGVVLLFNYWKQVEVNTAATERSNIVARASGAVPAPPPVAEVPQEALAGLRPEYEAALKAAYAQGPAALGAWLKRFGPYTGDPRKAAIELDYASFLTRTDPAEAKKIFARVKSRTPADSPLYPRVKRLENAYQ